MEDEDYILVPVELPNLPDIDRLPDVQVTWEHKEPKRVKSPQRAEPEKSVEAPKVDLRKAVIHWIITLSILMLLTMGLMCH